MFGHRKTDSCERYPRLAILVGEYILFPQTALPHWGVLMVGAKGPRRARFLSYVTMSISCGRREHPGHFLRSGTSFCVTGAGHRTLFHPRGRRSTFWRLLTRWQAWVLLEVIYRGRRSIWWTWTTLWKGRKSRFVKLSTVVIFDFGHDDDFVRPSQHFGIFNVHFSWCARCFQSIWHVLAQPSRDFARVGSLSLWRGANFALARATRFMFFRGDFFSLIRL